MPQSTLWEVLRFLHKGLAFPEACELTDAELLDRFLTCREERGFALLVERHGGHDLERRSAGARRLP